MPEFLRKITTPESLAEVAKRSVRVVAILLIAWVVVKVARRALPRFTRFALGKMDHRAGQSATEMAKQAETIGAILLSVAVVAVWGVALLMAMREAGFDIAPILAGAGVVGLAVGFGAQNLVRDVISGAFMLLENQVRVGDVAIINGKGGLVERLNLRTIVLRSEDGTVHVFPNGAITSLSNMTHEFSFYVFNIGVAYKEDTDRVAAVLKELGEELQKDGTLGPDILAPLEVMGVDAFQDSAVVVKARIKTKPIRQWAVGREMNRRIKKRFDELGIEIPFPHRTLFFGEGSPPFRVEGAEQGAANGSPRAPRLGGASPS